MSTITLDYYLRTKISQRVYLMVVGRGSWVVGRGSWVVGRGYKSWVVGVGVGKSRGCG